MPHLDEGQLTALLDGELTSAERAEAESHLATCPECRVLLEETRGLVREAGALVDAVQLPTDSSSRPVGPTTPAGIPERRTAEPPTRRGGGLTAWRSLGWAATIVVAVGLGWFASDLRYRAPVAAPMSDMESDRVNQAVMTAKSAEPTATPPVPATRPVPSDAARPAGNGAMSRPEEAGTRTPAIQATPTAPAPGVGLVSTNAVANDEVGKLAESGGERREAAERAAVGSTDPQAGRPAPAAFAAQAPAAGAVQSTEADLRRQRSNVRMVTLEEAVRTLGGTIRLVDGMVPARVEEVEPAEPGTRRIRVVYFDPPGRELWLDQARQLADSRDAYRALDDRAGLLAGDTIAIVNMQNPSTETTKSKHPQHISGVVQPQNRA